MNTHYKPQTFVAMGFSIIIFLIFIIISLWIYGESEKKKQAEEIISEQIESRRISKMLLAAHQRAITLYKMSSLEDPFERDEEYQSFLIYGQIIIKNRLAIAASDFTSYEKDVWKQVGKILNRGSIVQHKVLEMIEQERNKEAFQLLVSDLSPIQDELMEILTKILNSVETAFSLKLKKSAEKSKYIYVLIVSLEILSLILGFLTYIVTKRTARTESELASQADRLQSLYEVASASGLSFSDQIHETLKVGCRLFNLEIGKLCKIDPKENTNTFVDIVAPSKTSIKQGMIVPLEKTFCSIPYNEGNIVMLHNIATSEYKAYPCTEFADLGAYIAAPITIDGKKYGTVNFSSFKAKLTPFLQTDKDLLYLIGRWVGVALERELSEKYQLEKKFAEEADSAKSSFLANMSHELRTPLNAILGYSEILLEDCEEARDVNKIADLKKINYAGSHLLSLINDILDLSKIESGKMELFIEEFSIREMIESVKNTVRPLVAKNSNTFETSEIDFGATMCSDKTKIQQILFNLLSNAAKFTENGRIFLQVNEIDIDDISFIKIMVSDTGIGMTEDQAKIVFGEFTQADNSITRKYGGTGLGLSICKKFCQILGGDIKVMSTIGEGSEFSLTLPMNNNNVTV